MFQKNSRKVRVLGLLLVVLGAGMLGLGGLSAIEYSVPMAMERYSVASQRLSIGSRGKALYNAALVALDEHRWDEAAKNCEAAFSAVSDGNGQVSEADAGLAAETQFMLGFSLVELSKHEQAIAAYDRCLALMPDRGDSRQKEVVEAARRTREWLRQSAKSKGKSQPKPKPDTEQKAGKPQRKGRI